MSSPTVAVVGGGLAGLAASIALAESSFQIQLFERSPRLGGRATSYALSGNEVIDNCQHVTLRCCTNLEDFYRRIGVTDKIRYFDRLDFADSHGRSSPIQPGPLPAPFHLATSFAKFPFLNWSDKRGIAKAMLSILRSSGRPKLAEGMTMLNWLRQQKQTQAAVDRFWRTVLVSALNEELDRMDAAYGIAVFWKAFLSNPSGFVMGVPKVPLSDLYTIRNDRIQIHLRRGVASLLTAENTVRGVRLDDGTEVAADYTIAATTIDRLLKLLPEELLQHRAYAELAAVPVSPITSVHMWFDRPVMDQPFLTVLDQTTQWIFNRSGQYVQIVISASYALSEKSQSEIVEICRSELASVLPASKPAALTRSVVVRESAATFSPRPGCDRWRPSQKTPIRNFFIAGDWTQTSWPATMESAVRSGYLAAEGILGLEGRPTQLVVPELPSTGFAKWFA
jgi:zeta-carotene desaturase